MKPKTPQKFWKIRDKHNGFFVVKSIAQNEYNRRLDDASNKRRGVENKYAVVSTLGKTYTTLSGAMTMMNQLAGTIGSHRTLDQMRDEKERRRYIFEQTTPYFELVEYEIIESRVIKE